MKINFDQSGLKETKLIYVSICISAGYQKKKRKVILFMAFLFYFTLAPFRPEVKTLHIRQDSLPLLARIFF